MSSGQPGDIAHLSFPTRGSTRHFQRGARVAGPEGGEERVPARPALPRAAGPRLPLAALLPGAGRLSEG